MRNVVLRTPLLLVLASALLAGCMNHELSTELPGGVATLAAFSVGCDADEGVRVTALIGAITNANTNPGANVIDLAPGCTYTLTTVNNADGGEGSNGLPVVTGELSINGNGATIQRSSAADTPPFRIFFFDRGSTVVISGLTVSNGTDEEGFGGGGAFAFGPLTVMNSTFSSNVSSGNGGGILSPEAELLTVTNSTFSGNSGSVGGGITSGNLVVANSAFIGNSAMVGGAIRAAGNMGSALVVNSTFSGNSAENDGGAISSQTGLLVTNSTFYRNHAREGGGIATDGLFGASVRNSILFDSSCSGSTLSDGGLNLDSGATCVVSDANGSLSVTDPLLGPLQDNGGPTKTHALLTGSPAIDRIPVVDGTCNGTGVTVDQRGISRPQGTACDIGAFEVEVEVERPLDIQRPSIKIEQVLISDATRAGMAEGSFVIRNASGGEDTLVTLGDVTVTFRSDGRRVRTWHTATCDVTPLATGYELDPAEAKTFTYACHAFVPAIPSTAGEATAVVTVAEMWNQLGEHRNGPPRTTSEPFRF